MTRIRSRTILERQAGRLTDMIRYLDRSISTEQSAVRPDDFLIATLKKKRLAARDQRRRINRTLAMHRGNKPNSYRTVYDTTGEPNNV